MGHTITFDTLSYAKKLIAAGVPTQQAEVQAEALVEIIDEQLATKHDLKEMEVALSLKLKELEMHLTFRLGAMIAASIAIVAALVKLH